MHVQEASQKRKSLTGCSDQILHGIAQLLSTIQGYLYVDNYIVKMLVKWEHCIVFIKLALICYLSLVATTQSGGKIILQSVSRPLVVIKPLQLSL